MSTEYIQLLNVTDGDFGHYAPQTQPEQVFDDPPPEYPTCPPGNADQMKLVGAPQVQTITPRVNTRCEPNDYFRLALFVTTCCFLPLGIVGLIKANDVRNRFRVGDYVGAMQASKEAKRYSCIGLVIGIVAQVVWIIVVIIFSVIYVWNHAELYDKGS